MKTKIVEHIAADVYHKLQSAIGECKDMRRKYPELGDKQGIGLDFAVLSEKLDSANKLILLLTQ
jgi:hypothetical protein